MRLRRIAAVAATAALLGVAACGGGSGSDEDAGTLPAKGVPPDTDPMPMPQAGHKYNNPQDHDDVSDGGTLKLPITELGPNFNTFSVDGNTTYVSEIMFWIAPTMWDYNVGGEPTPNTEFLESTELVNESPETVHYKINEDATWNDGSPITWRAFEATWKIMRGDGSYSPAATDGYSSIKSVEQGDSPKDVIVTFKENFYPYQVVFDNIAHPKMTDPQFYKKGLVNKIPNKIMAGPYKVDSLSKEKLVLVPNPDWWGKEPKLDKIVYRQMEDSASINAFQNGEVDATSVGNADRLEQIKSMEDVLVRRDFQTSTSVYTMGQDSELFSNDAARKAFILGTNREQLAEVRFQGMDWEEEPPGSALSYPWQDGYKDNMEGLHYDPDKAKKILDEAGWEMGDDGYRHKDGNVAEFTYVTFSDDPITEALARAQQKMSKEIGLKMNIDIRKSTEFSKTITNGTFDVVAMGWRGTDPFGYAWLCQIYCSESESNFSGLGNPELDKKLKEAGTISDRQKAWKVGNAAEKEALQLFGTFPLYNGPRMTAVQEGLANWPRTSGFSRVDPQDVGWVK